MNEYNKNDIFWKTFAGLPGNSYLLEAKLRSFNCLFVFLTRKTSTFSGDYPIALGYMASLLRMNGAKAKILVQYADSYDEGSFSGFDMICFYPMVALLQETADFAAKVKADNPEVPICFFNSEQHQHEMLFCVPKAVDIGLHVMERSKAVDFILIGEAEYSFLKLCEQLAFNRKDFNSIPRCLFREGDAIRLSEEPIRPVDFDYLPYPSRDYLEQTMSDDGINSSSVRVQSSRGCVSRCLYCVESSSNITSGGRKKIWTGRHIVKFVDEIEMLSKDYGIVFFNVIDSSFEDPGKNGIERMNIFCDEILSRNINASFKIHLRVETISKLSDDFIVKLKDAGCDVLILGVESGLEHELRSYKKITTVQENIDNCKRLESFGKFFLLLGHMMFSPFLKLDHLPLKIEFLKKLRHGWDYMNVSNNLLAFAGTAYHELIKEKGLAAGNDIFSGTVSYRYEDERIRLVSDEMGSLKIRCPEVIHLNNLFYDALNMKARYLNKMNSHLWNDESIFNKFAVGIDEMLRTTEDVYADYFLLLVDLADSGWSEAKADRLFRDMIHDKIPSLAESARILIEDFVSGFEKRGLSTGRLYLKTWMSIINTQINTASGKI